MESTAHRPWNHAQPASERELHRRLADEGLRPYSWSNGPGDCYSVHRHSYDKVIYVVRGTITFGLPETGEQVQLEPGDRLELPAGVLHDALVGPLGVLCLEAHC